MNKYLLLRLCLVLLILTSVLTLSALDAESVHAKIVKAYSGLSSWQSAITQTNIFTQTNSKLVSSGNFYYKPGKLAIRYTKPQEQVLIVNGGKVTVYDKASKAALRSTLTSSVQSLNPVEIVNTYWAKSARKVTSSAPGSTVLTLTPQKDDTVKSVTITVQDKTGYISRLRYTDKSGNSVDISFAKVVVNKSIPASVFTLSLPKGVQVIER